MNSWFRGGLAGVLGVTCAFWSIGARGQGIAKPEIERPAQAASGDSLEKIVEDYNRGLIELDRRRLGRLATLAAGQAPAEAAATYEELFRLAIEGNQFREAEPAALAVVQKGSPSSTAVGLAYLVKIIAECDRGAYDASLESLRSVVVDKAADGQVQEARGRLLTPERIELCDAYFQRLIHADQYEVARKAFALIKAHAQDAEFTTWLEARLSRLNQVGKPAPDLAGTDLDGKKLSMADAKGKVVLIVFWASWSVPSAAEVAALQKVYAANKAKGFQVVGINVDAMQEGSPGHEAITPLVRRFLIDRNVTWPNLINGSGANDYAKAFGVTEIPANVLIARDGNVAGIDLVPKNMESAVAKEVGR